MQLKFSKQIGVNLANNLARQIWPQVRRKFDRQFDARIGMRIGVQLPRTLACHLRSNLRNNWYKIDQTWCTNWFQSLIQHFIILEEKKHWYFGTLVLETKIKF